MVQCYWCYLLHNKKYIKTPRKKGLRIFWLFFSIITYPCDNWLIDLGLIIITILPFSFFWSCDTNCHYHHLIKICIRIKISFPCCCASLASSASTFLFGAANLLCIEKVKGGERATKEKLLIHCSAAAIPKFFLEMVKYLLLVGFRWKFNFTKNYNLTIQTHNLYFCTLTN